jgi:hypothetical protein
VTKDVETTGIIKVDQNELKAASTFKVQLSDYGIKIPNVVKDKISNNVKIVVDCKLEALKA